MRQLREGQEDPHPVMEGQEIFNDIGFFIQATKSVEEILESVHKMSEARNTIYLGTPTSLLNTSFFQHNSLLAEIGHSRTGGWRNMADGWCTVPSLKVPSVCAVP